LRIFLFLLPFFLCLKNCCKGTVLLLRKNNKIAKRGLQAHFIFATNSSAYGQSPPSIGLTLWRLHQKPAFRHGAVETHGVRLSDEIAMPAAPQQVREKKTLTGRVAPCEGYGKAPRGI
jgi:hypothetical protein